MEAWDKYLFTIFPVEKNGCKCTSGSDAVVCRMHKKASKI